MGNRLKVPEGFQRPATTRALDFRNVVDTYYARDERGLLRIVNRQGYLMEHAAGTGQTDWEEPMKNSPGTGLALSRKQMRARARRRIQNGDRMADEAFAALYKPIEEWDLEELARGRPRNPNGTFSGRPSKYITREVHERAMELFRSQVRLGMNVATIPAVNAMQLIIESEEVDNRGKPIVPMSTKLEAAKYLLDHTVGKPVQPTSADISVKLQAILGSVMVNPAEMDGYSPGHVGTRGELPGEVEDPDGGE